MQGLGVLAVPVEGPVDIPSWRVLVDVLGTVEAVGDVLLGGVDALTMEVAARQSQQEVPTVSLGSLSAQPR